jgi:hypothetical protein
MTSGPHGTIWALSGDQVYRLRPAAEKWEPMAVPSCPKMTNGLPQLSSSPEAVYLFKQGCVYRASLKDTEFAEVGSLPADFAGIVLGVRLTPANRLWLFGADCAKSKANVADIKGTECIPARKGSHLVATIWEVSGGTLRAAYSSPTASRITDIVFATQRDVFALTDVGLRVTHDGGRSWRSSEYWRALREAEPFDRIPLSISFPDTRVGYLALRGGYLLKTENGGATWAVTPGARFGLARQREWERYFSCLLFVSRDHGFAIDGGGHLFMTLDGGSQWSVLEGESYRDFLVTPSAAYAYSKARLKKLGALGE